MTTYVYKSTTGGPVNVDSYVVTVNPGLESYTQIAVLDELIGVSVNRYDDGVLATADNRIVVRGINNAAGAFNTLSFNNQPSSVSRTLLNYTGATVLTGGTANTKTVLKQVALPNGWGLDYKAGIRVSAIFGFSLNSNTKSFGVDFGTSAGSATTLWSRTRTSASHGGESVLLDLQRSNIVIGSYVLGYGGNISTEGIGIINTPSYTTILTTSVPPTTNNTYLYFWGNLITSEADQVTLARAKVDLYVAEY